MEKHGFICLHRSIMDEKWFKEPFTKGQAWIDMLLMAAYKNTTVEIRGISVSLKRGQLAMSEETYSKRWQWHRSKVRRYLDYLASESLMQIKVNTTNVTSVVTIVNYEKYQAAERKTSTRKTPPKTVQQNAQQNAQQNVQQNAQQNVQQIHVVNDCASTSNRRTTRKTVRQNVRQNAQQNVQQNAQQNVHIQQYNKRTRSLPLPPQEGASEGDLGASGEGTEPGGDEVFRMLVAAMPGLTVLGDRMARQAWPLDGEELMEAAREAVVVAANAVGGIRNPMLFWRKQLEVQYGRRHREGVGSLGPRGDEPKRDVYVRQALRAEG